VVCGYRILGKTGARGWVNAIRRPAGLEQATHYPIFIEPGNEARAWGVVVPDLPGCFSTGDTLDEAIIAAEQAAAAWIDVALDAGMPIPPSSPAANWAGQFPGWLLGVVNIEPALLDDSTERINITLPRRVLARLDAKARECGESRSSHIAGMALG